ncbi:MAG: hypothetical protein MH321_07465 [Leptospiraceae bacterium]|nr:hypothetical protein [Leptospiraceae bacterium]
MLVVNIKIFKILKTHLFFILLIQLHCLNPNQGSSNAILGILNDALTQEIILENKIMQACLVNTKVSSFKVATCFLTKPENCNLKYFNNIRTTSIRQNRFDDLTFININFPNCSAGASQLLTKYSLIQAPASMLFKDVWNLNGINNATDFQFTTHESCENLGLYASKYLTASFERQLSAIEISQLDNLNSDLALMSSTSNACLNDLNYNTTLLNLTGKVKANIILRGISCSNNTASGFPVCPWL